MPCGGPPMPGGPPTPGGGACPEAAAVRAVLGKRQADHLIGCACALSIRACVHSRAGRCMPGTDAHLTRDREHMHSPSHHAQSSNTASNTRTRHPHTQDLEAASHPSPGAEVQAPPPDAAASMAAFPEAACPAEARPCLAEGGAGSRLAGGEGQLPASYARSGTVTR